MSKIFSFTLYTFNYSSNFWKSVHLIKDVSFKLKLNQKAKSTVDRNKT